MHFALMYSLCIPDCRHVGLTRIRNNLSSVRRFKVKFQFFCGSATEDRLFRLAITRRANRQYPGTIQPRPRQQKLQFPDQSGAWLPIRRLNQLPCSRLSQNHIRKIRDNYVILLNNERNMDENLFK